MRPLTSKATEWGMLEGGGGVLCLVGRNSLRPQEEDVASIKPMDSDGLRCLPQSSCVLKKSELSSTSLAAEKKKPVSVALAASGGRERRRRMTKALQ